MHPTLIRTHSIVTGLVEWDTVDEAMNALVLANHHPIHVSGCIHPFHLKLAYSPKPICEERAGLSVIRYPAPPLKTTNTVNQRQDDSNAPADLLAAMKAEEEAAVGALKMGSHTDDSVVKKATSELAGVGDGAQTDGETQDCKNGAT